MSRVWREGARWLCVANLWLLLQVPVQAQHDLHARQRESAELTGKAAIAFNAGDLAEARDLLLKAREVFANPIIDYNLGRAYEGLGQPSLAVESYTRYLIAVPDAANAGLVRQRIETLSDASAQAVSAQAVSAKSPDPTHTSEQTAVAPNEKSDDVDQTVGVSPWPVVTAGVGLLAVGVGLGLSIDAQAQADDALAAPVSQMQAAMDVEAARDQNTVGNIVWVSGVALVTAGIVWLVVELLDDGEGQLQARGSGVSVPF